MKSIKKSFRLYLPFSRSVVQTLLSYRMNLYIFVLAELIKVFVAFYLWKAIFADSTNSLLNGFSINDMILYIFISAITAGTIANDTDRNVGMEVKDGSIAMNLIKPINYKVRLLFNAFGNVFFNTMFVCLPLWLCLIVLRYFFLGELPPDIITMSMYLISLLLAFTITFLFNFSFGLISFYVTNLWGVCNVKRAIIIFFSGELIPIMFFPLWAQKCLSFVPFGSMNYTPVMIYLKKLTGYGLIKALGIQLMWVIILYLITNLLWNKAIKHLTILGG